MSNCCWRESAAKDNESAASIVKMLLRETAAEESVAKEINLYTRMDNYRIDCVYILYV